MNLDDLKAKIRLFEERGRDLAKAIEMLESFEASKDMPTALIILLDTWIDCPMPIIVKLLRAHVKKITNQLEEIRKEIGVE